MAKGPNTLLDGVAEETMTEMAASFFGARKEVETLLARMEELAAELREKSREVLARGAALSGLLPGEEGMREFFAALGVDPEQALKQLPPGGAAEAPKPAFAVTPGGRFAARVLAAYGAFQEALEDYRHGSYSPDPDNPGRMRQSPNLDQLDGLAQAANQRMEALKHAPSESLGFARRMDVAEAQRQKHTGATLENYQEHLDHELAFEPADPDKYGLPRLWDLPPAAEAKKTLTPLLKRLYREDQN